MNAWHDNWGTPKGVFHTHLPSWFNSTKRKKEEAKREKKKKANGGLIDVGFLGVVEALHKVTDVGADVNGVYYHTREREREREMFKDIMHTENLSYL